MVRPKTITEDVKSKVLAYKLNNPKASQQEIAEACGISQTSVHRILNSHSKDSEGKILPKEYNLLVRLIEEELKKAIGEEGYKKYKELSKEKSKDIKNTIKAVEAQLDRDEYWINEAVRELLFVAGQHLLRSMNLAETLLDDIERGEKYTKTEIKEFFANQMKLWKFNIDCVLEVLPTRLQRRTIDLYKDCLEENVSAELLFTKDDKLIEALIPEYLKK